MNDGQVKQIVLAIRAHARAMVAGRLWAQAEAGTDVNHVVADADTLLEALSASSGGDGQSESQVANATPGREPGQGSKEAATPPLSADLVTVRRDDLEWLLTMHPHTSLEWDRLREAVRR